MADTSAVKSGGRTRCSEPSYVGCRWANSPTCGTIVRRLEDRGLVDRFPCPEDGRATNARLTDAGWDVVVAAAPGHVNTVRRNILDPLTRERVTQLRDIANALLTGSTPRDG